MMDFIAQKYDVLLATTIIGTDSTFPTSTPSSSIGPTDMGSHSCISCAEGLVAPIAPYAYLLIPPEDSLLQWLEGAGRHQGVQRLGSGFRVAALDLEIRGAEHCLAASKAGTSSRWVSRCT